MRPVAASAAGGAWRAAVPYLVLAALTLAVFAPVGGHPFIGYDDDLIVTLNPRVAGGFSAGNARWALTSFSGSNWNPLTRFSHMLDVELFGLDAGRHHLVNLLLHLGNVLLLHGVLSSLTGARWRSALVAGLFAAHPLHVESVAWIAERKDVLSTLFGLLALGAYLRYVRRPGRGRLAAVAALLALGLTAKPMLVTLPLVLLLLDWWPLGRLRSASSGGLAARVGSLLPLLREKALLLLLAVASSVVTMIAQSRGGAVSSLEAFPAAARVANALVAYAAYLGKFVWPVDLAIIYPVRPSWSWLPAAGAAAALAALTALAAANARRRPHLLAGWLWYCGMLVPVSGLVQVGLQSMADRYTYLPLVGIFIALAWAAAEAATRMPSGRMAVAVPCAIALALMAALGRAQVGYWKDDERLFRHAVAATRENHVALNNLGVYLAGHGQVEEGIALLREAIRVRPGDSKSWANLGMVLAGHGRAAEAEPVLRTAVRIKPDAAVPHNNLGIALALLGRLEPAQEQFVAALSLQPDYADARSNLAHAYELQGRLEQARDTYRAALAENPRQAQAHRGLARVLQRLGNGAEAARHAREAARLASEAGGR